MHFRLWENPFDADTLIAIAVECHAARRSQPRVTPDVVVVPLVAFTSEGTRLGQGGGHYDRWLAENPLSTAIGLAWDCQLADALPAEDHDQPLTAS